MVRRFAALVLALALLAPGLARAQLPPASGLVINSTPVQGGSSGQCLFINNQQLSSQACGGAGTVTSVSVTTANGVSGTVATATTTPAISLTLGAITPSTVNGNTLTTGTGTLTLAAGKTLTVSNSLTLAGTDATTMTFPATSASVARTDAGQTFTGTQTFSSTIAGNISGSAATVTTNANLTGAVTSVGNAASLGSFTSANLISALTDETGSGVAVFGTAPILSTVDARGTWTTGTSWTLPAFTLGGTVSGGGNQLNNIIVGTATPLAGSFTTVSGSTSLTSPIHYGGSAAGSTLTLQSTSSGSPSGDSIALTTGGSARQTILSAGNIGMGTETNPVGKVVISSNTTTGISGVGSTTLLTLFSADANNALFGMYSYGAGFNPAILQTAARGTAASPSASQSGDVLGVYIGGGYAASAYDTAFRSGMSITASENHTLTANGTYVSLLTVPNTTTTRAEAMRVQPSGGVTIGATITTDPGIGGLQINGQTFVPNVASDTATTDATACIATSGGKLLKGTGTLGICLGTSGRQFKTAFAPMAAGIDEIARLKLWNYRYRSGYGDGGARLQYGPTAQDVERVLPGLVRHDAKGAAINYDIGAFVPISLRALQQLNARIEQLERRVRRARH